jgi:hypothetical protein
MVRSGEVVKRPRLVADAPDASDFDDSDFDDSEFDGFGGFDGEGLPPPGGMFFDDEGGFGEDALFRMAHGDAGLDAPDDFDDALDDDEEGADEEGDEDDEEGDDDEEEGDDASHIDVDFSVDAMIESDIADVASHLERFLPDAPDAAAGAKCAPTDLATAIFRRGCATSIVTADGEDDDDEGGAGEGESGAKAAEYYGVLSLINFADAAAAAAGKPLAGALAGIARLLESPALQPLPQLSNGGAAHPAALLRARCAGLVVAELFAQLPPALVARLFQCFVREVLETKGAAPPAHVVFLAKVVPARADAVDKTPLAASAQAARGSVAERTRAKPAKRARAEDDGNGGDDQSAGGAAARGGLGRYVTFARFEDELLYRARDTATLVAVGKVTRDAADERRCLCFAVRWNSFVAVTQEIAVLARSSA